MDQIRYGFPILTIPEKEKDEKWYKDYVQAIINRSVSDGYVDRYNVANECVNFYLGLQTGEEFDFLQKAEDGDILPAMWMNYNRINTKINLMIGELSQKKYEIFVEGLNKELKSRKLKEKEKMRIDLRFQPIADELSADSGLPLQAPPQQGGFLPQSEEELDDFFDREYKDIAEIVVTAMLKYLAKVNNWDYQRIALFRDILIMGMSFCRTELIDGVPVSQRVDPRNMVWDVNATDDFLSDSTYFGELYYMNIGDAINQFGLSKKEIEEAYGEYKDFLAGNVARFTSGTDYGFLGRNNTLRFFKSEGGDLRILVCKACWVDFKPYNNKITQDQYGETHIQKTGPDATSKEVKKTMIKTWRQGTLIGGKFLKNYGEIPNQARNWTGLTQSDAPYKALIPNYMNGVAISKVHMMKNLQQMKNMSMYRLQLDMARAGAKGYIYDINQMPAGMKLEQVMKYLKTAGIMIIDSSNPSSFNQFKEIDLTISNNITAYLEISAMCDREMDAISGINEARQGMVQNASQAVGVTQSSLFQSALSTAVYYDLFSQFCSNVLTQQAKLGKIAWAGKERFAPIIGDVGVDFLEVDIDMDLHDYAVFVSEVPEMIQDKQMYQQMIIAAVQAGQLSFVQALNLLLEKDVRVGVRKLERETRKMQEQQQQQEQAMMQQQQEQLMAEQQSADSDRKAKVLDTQMKNEAALKQVMAQGRMDMRGELIDFKKQLALAKIQKDIEKARLASKPKTTKK